MIKKQSNLSREEFELDITKKLKKAIEKAKQNRKLLRQLEKDIGDKQEKINHYEDTVSNLQKQLVDLLAIMYSKGT